MSQNYDIEDVLFLARRGMSAAFIKEELGLGISERQVQRLVSARLGRRPTRPSISKPDLLRERVVAYMQARGLNPRRCSSCGRVRGKDGAIRALSPDLSLDALVFVCLKCATPGDV